MWEGTLDHIRWRQNKWPAVSERTQSLRGVGIMLAGSQRWFEWILRLRLQGTGRIFDQLKNLTEHFVYTGPITYFRSVHTELWQGSYSFELFKFHDFPWLFSWPFQVLQGLKLSCHFQKFSKLSLFWSIFDLKQLNRHKLWCPPKCLPFAQCNYFSLSYIVLALSSAVTKLPNKTLIFHDFYGPTIQFHAFQGQEN